MKTFPANLVDPSFVLTYLQFVLLVTIVTAAVFLIICAVTRSIAPFNQPGFYGAALLLLIIGYIPFGFMFDGGVLQTYTATPNDIGYNVPLLQVNVGFSRKWGPLEGLLGS